MSVSRKDNKKQKEDGRLRRKYKETGRKHLKPESFTEDGNRRYKLLEKKSETKRRKEDGRI